MVGLADAPLIASMSKDVLFVVESGKTRTGVAREAVSKLNLATREDIQRLEDKIEQLLSGKR